MNLSFECNNEGYDSYSTLQHVSLEWHEDFMMKYCTVHNCAVYTPHYLCFQRGVVAVRFLCQCGTVLYDIMFRFKQQ